MKCIIMLALLCLAVQSTVAEPNLRTFSGEIKKIFTINGKEYTATVYSPPVAISTLQEDTTKIDPSFPDDILKVSVQAMAKRDFESFRKLHWGLSEELKRVEIPEDEYKTDIIEGWKAMDAKDYLCARVEKEGSFLYVIGYIDPRTNSFGKHKSVVQIVKVQDKYFIKPNINSTDEVIAFLRKSDITVQPSAGGDGKPAP